jgi:hypothetical protein
LLAGRLNAQPILTVDLTLDERLVEMNSYRIFRPSFMVFLKEHYRNFQQELRSISYRKLLPEFFTRMRLVLDARYNEFVTAASWRDFTCFPDFLYGLFERFDMDLTYKCLRPTEVNNPTEKDQLRINFVLDLINPKLDEAWEVKLFREFLFENTTNEEMYFYLHFRQQLLSGPLSANYFTMSSPIIFVALEDAITMLDNVLEKYEQNYIDKIKIAIASKKRLKGSRYVVDANLVLRTLL